MAKLPRCRALRLAAALATAIAALSSPGRADEIGGEAVELVGTWHVLVHYTDDHSHDPGQLRWDDRVWVFERSGSRLRWTEYPIVVFEDQTGRFDRSMGRLARVLHGWEPNPAQLAQIESGLEVNDRGSKSKTLRRDGKGGWRSTTRPTAASASVITYVENWIIEDASVGPIFRREDVMGSARAQSLEGVTEYATTERGAGGRVLRGTFERDGSRHGTFRMMRSGAARAVEGHAKTEGQRFYREFLEPFGAAFPRSEGALQEAVARRAKGDGEVPSEVRKRARAEIRAALEASIREAGWDARLFEREVASLTRKIEELVLGDGRSLDEVVQMIRNGKINP